MDLPVDLRQELIKMLLEGEYSQSVVDWFATLTTDGALYQLIQWGEAIRRNFEPKRHDTNAIFSFRYRLAMNLMMLNVTVLKLTNPNINVSNFYESERFDIVNFLFPPDVISDYVYRALTVNKLKTH